TNKISIIQIYWFDSFKSTNKRFMTIGVGMAPCAHPCPETNKICNQSTKYFDPNDAVFCLVKFDSHTIMEDG
ncbi:MAG: hypothetical protein ACRCX5_14195, partial [Bacteroidales bacterium]